VNWGRGLFRLWLVTSVIWVGGWFLAMRPDQAYNKYSTGFAEAKSIVSDATPYQNATTDKDKALWAAHMEKLRRTDDRIEGNKRDMQSFVAIGPGFSLGLLIIGGGLYWAFRGFRDN